MFKKIIDRFTKEIAGIYTILKDQNKIIQNIQEGDQKFVDYYVDTLKEINERFERLENEVKDCISLIKDCEQKLISNES